MRKLLIILLLFISFFAFADNANYYVDNTGTGDTLSTIAEVNALTLNPDDTVFFKCGCTWREELNIPNSGTAGHYIVFTSYGTGNKPKILGSDQATSFTNVSGNIWGCSNSLNDPYNLFGGGSSYYSEIYFIELDGTINWSDAKKTYTVNFSNLTNEYDWTWNGNTIYVYAATDPDSRYTSVEVPQRVCGITIGIPAGGSYWYPANGVEYITINGLEVAYAACRTIMSEYPTQELTGLTISNNYLHHVGSRYNEIGYNISALRSDLLIKDNEVCEAGRRNCSVHIQGSDSITAENITYDGNYLHNGYHSTGINANVAAGPENHYRHIIVKNNLVYDPDVDQSTYSEYGAEMCAIRQESDDPTNTIEDVKIYNNIFINTMGNGIYIGGVDTAIIYNNTLYRHNTKYSGSIQFNQLTVYDTCTEVSIKNNLFYGDAYYSYSHYRRCIYIPTSTDETEIDMDYNFFYQVSDSMTVVSVNGLTYTTNYGTRKMSTIDEAFGYQVQANINFSSGLTDPLFIGVIIPITDADSLMLDVLSPAIDEGIGLGEYTTYDYYDSLRDENPDIGAIEYNPEDYDPPPTMPSVTTTTPVARYSRLVSIGGSGIDAGGGTITAKGVCYSTSANPTISDSKVSGGTGTGSFGVLCPVTAGTTYHFRAYCQNAEGVAYGADLSIQTPKKSTAKTNNKLIKTGGKVVIIH